MCRFLEKPGDFTYIRVENDWRKDKRQDPVLLHWVSPILYLPILILTRVLYSPLPTEIRRMGFWGAKVPLPYSPLDGFDSMRRNLDFLKAHREKVGPDYPIMVDCVGIFLGSFKLDPDLLFSGCL